MYATFDLKPWEWRNDKRICQHDLVVIKHIKKLTEGQKKFVAKNRSQYQEVINRKKTQHN